MKTLIRSIILTSMLIALMLGSAPAQAADESSLALLDIVGNRLIRTPQDEDIGNYDCRWFVSEMHAAISTASSKSDLRVLRRALDSVFAALGHRFLSPRAEKFFLNFRPLNAKEALGALEADLDKKLKAD